MRHKGRRGHYAGAPMSLYSCYVLGCGFTCSQRRVLQVHVRKHTGETTYACDVLGCNYECALKLNLARHTSAAHKRRPFAEHMRTHSGERLLHACKARGCGYASSNAGNLRAHQRVHAGECPFVCQVADCGFAVMHMNSLTRHMHKHGKHA